MSGLLPELDKLLEKASPQLEDIVKTATHQLEGIDDQIKRLNETRARLVAVLDGCATMMKLNKDEPKRVKATHPNIIMVGGVMVGEGGDLNKTDFVRQMVRENPDQGVSAAEIYHRFKDLGFGVQRNYVYSILKRLVEYGDVVKKDKRVFPVVNETNPDEKNVSE